MNVYFTVRQKRIYAYSDTGVFFESNINNTHEPLSQWCSSCFSRGFRCSSNSIEMGKYFSKWLVSLNSKDKISLVGYNVSAKWEYLRRFIDPQYFKFINPYPVDIIKDFKWVNGKIGLSISEIQKRMGNVHNIYLNDKGLCAATNFCKGLYAVNDMREQLEFQLG
jgi:hypothetical protein